MLTVEDRYDIAETLALHAYVFDENQLDRLGDLFLPDAVYDMSALGMGVFHGAEAIGRAAARMSASGLAPWAHFVTNVVATETGEGTASVRSKVRWSCTTVRSTRRCMTTPSSGTTAGG
jgi:hypothetical protein